jgi:L-iditol 2-dehydrogenase
MLRLGEIEIEERPVPEPGPGQVLAEGSAGGVCGFDVHWFTEGRTGERVVNGPSVLGHEAGGVVRGAGPGCEPAEPRPTRRPHAVQLDQLVTGHYGLSQVAATMQTGRTTGWPCDLSSCPVVSRPKRSPAPRPGRWR